MRWHIFGAGLEPIEAASISALVERLRARLGSYSVSRPLTLKSPEGTYYHIPPNKRIEVRNCRPGVYCK